MDCFGSLEIRYNSLKKRQPRHYHHHHLHHQQQQQQQMKRREAGQVEGEDDNNNPASKMATANTTLTILGQKIKAIELRTKAIIIPEETAQHKS